MNRKLGVVLGIVVVALALVLWRCTGRGDSAKTNPAPAPSAKVAPTSTGFAPKPKIDPRTQPRGSIAGTVRDEAKAPIAGANVCVDVSSDELPSDVADDPICVVTDAAGAYKFGDLYRARYTVTAGARPYRPEVYKPNGARGDTSFPLAAGEAKTGVDLVLANGGAEITGVVSDINGGGVAHALVRARTGMWGGGITGPAVETDADGKFSLWTRPGSVRVSAVADGYAPASEGGRAPGAFTLLLTPESSLAGTVVDARTGAPVADAEVGVDGTDPSFEGARGGRSDAQGKFRVTKLTPGRYVVTARLDHGYGRTEGSTRVGLGEHVDGVVVKVFPAIRITGKVMIAGAKPTVCTDAGVWLHDSTATERWVGATTEDDGTVIAKGVLPGTYTPQVWCRDHKARDKYDPIVVADKDLDGLIWEVETGGTLRGKVVTKRGEPVPDARIDAQTTGGDARAKTDWANDVTDLDGSYELTGLKAATYELHLKTDRGVVPKDGFKVEVGAGATVDKDLVIEDGGEIRGTVSDAQGAPVAGVDIHAWGSEQSYFMMGGTAAIKTDATGSFVVPALRPGDYRVVASRGWSNTLRKPGANDDTKRGEKATVKAGQTTTIKLVVESQTASIKGVVVDPDGKPVSDAFLSSARESDAAGANTDDTARETRGWGWGDGEKPILTATDGSFTVPDLSPGKYVLRAYRKGGGEAIQQHVQTGSTARLQIQRTGSIAGVATRDGGTPLAQLTVTVTDKKTGFERRETFFRTDGRFVLDDLPAGAFDVEVSGDGASKIVPVPLAEGEAKTGIVVTLEELLTITGRVVDQATRQPVAGIQVFASLVGGDSSFMIDGEDMDFVTDDAGRFTLRRAPRGRVALQGSPKNWKDSGYSWFRTVRTIAGSGTVDIGDLSIMRSRIKPNETAGELGVSFKQQPRDTPPDQVSMEVSFIRPDGAAASSGLKVGDVFTSVDGVDITGEGSSNAWTLLRAPAGTKLTIGLARGATVEITLKPPS